MKVTARELRKVLDRLPDPNICCAALINVPVFLTHRDPEYRQIGRDHMDSRIVTCTKRATKVGRMKYVEWELDVG